MKTLAEEVTEIVNECKARKDPTLDLSGKPIIDLPSSISNCGHVRNLKLDQTNLEHLDERVLQEMPNLRTFSCRNSRIRKFPEGLVACKELTHVDVSNGQLSEIGSGIGVLSKLEFLNIADNVLTLVPEDISRCTALGSLNLSGNRLKQLPRGISAIPKTCLIDLRRNPLDEPLSSLLRQGQNYLLAYLSSLQDSAVAWELKCLVVGEGHTGKTSLIEALRGNPFVRDRPYTHGIEIGSFEAPLPAIAKNHDTLDSDTVLVRAWDFGGQRIYRITHHLFFTAPALYLVVWQPREGAEEARVREWINTIIARVGTDARFIVIETHADEAIRAPVGQAALYREFAPCIVDFRSVDNESGNGIVDLRSIIGRVAADMPSTQHGWKATWTDVRDDLGSIHQPYISMGDFSEICVKHGVAAADHQILATILHEIGDILFFHSDHVLESYIVLDPEWVSQSVAAALEEDSFSSSNGIVDSADLSRVWSRYGDVFPSELHPYLLRLMERFEISYRLSARPDERRSLIAELVQEQEPPFDWPRRPGLGRRQKVVCILSTALPGLAARLIVRHHRYSIGMHWQAGCVLRDVQSDTLARIEVHDRRVTVEVRGEYPEYLFAILRDGLEELLQEYWPGVAYDLFVPCPASQCSGTFRLRALVEFRGRHMEEVNCDMCYRTYSLARLLTGYDDPSRSIEGSIETLVRAAKAVEASAELVARSANDIRAIKNLVSAEIADCPKVFSIAASTRRWRSKRPWNRPCRLTLWCEEPHSEHPLPEAYVFNRPEKWFRIASPYIRVLAQMLSLAMPLSANALAAVGIALPDSLTADIQLMKDIGDRLDPAIDQGGVSYGAVSVGRRRNALREFRQLLFELDPSRGFRGLSRVINPSGDILWVCPTHYSVYDPPSPAFP